jgi:hypothetical protein
VSPKEFSSVFSRSFVIGHFLPAFFAIGVAALLTAAGGLPDAFPQNGTLAAKLLAVGVAALPVGLLLSGVHAHVLRTFSGEATERHAAEDAVGHKRGRRWPLKQVLKVHEWRVKRMRGQRDDWARQATKRGDPIAELTFDQYFPSHGRLLPTRLGNAIRAFQSHGDSRYGLDGALVWPRIEMLLGDEERRVIEDARTDVVFFLNCAVSTIPVAAWLAIDTAQRRSSRALIVLAILIVAVALWFGLRLMAVTATYRWGTPVRAAFDVHRLELYDRLGVRRPVDADDERALAAAVNEALKGVAGVPGPMRAPAVDGSAGARPAGSAGS